jgi:hypothetical protein
MIFLSFSSPLRLRLKVVSHQEKTERVVDGIILRQLLSCTETQMYQVQSFNLRLYFDHLFGDPAVLYAIHDTHLKRYNGFLDQKVKSSLQG